VFLCLLHVLAMCVYTMGCFPTHGHSGHWRSPPPPPLSVITRVHCTLIDICFVYMSCYCSQMPKSLFNSGRLVFSDIQRFIIWSFFWNISPGMKEYSLPNIPYEIILIDSTEISSRFVPVGRVSRIHLSVQIMESELRGSCHSPLFSFIFSLPPHSFGLLVCY
jgi:hypothetical protein